jgi:hypothetical protein
VISCDSCMDLTQQYASLERTAHSLILVQVLHHLILDRRVGRQASGMQGSLGEAAVAEGSHMQAPKHINDPLNNPHLIYPDLLAYTHIRHHGQPWQDFSFRKELWVRCWRLFPYCVTALRNNKRADMTTPALLSRPLLPGHSSMSRSSSVKPRIRCDFPKVSPRRPISTPRAAQ